MDPSDEYPSDEQLREELVHFLFHKVPDFNPDTPNLHARRLGFSNCKYGYEVDLREAHLFCDAYPDADRLAILCAFDNANIHIRPAVCLRNHIDVTDLGMYRSEDEFEYPFTTTGEMRALLDRFFNRDMESMAEQQTQASARIRAAKEWREYRRKQLMKMTFCIPEAIRESIADFAIEQCQELTVDWKEEFELEPKKRKLSSINSMTADEKANAIGEAVGMGLSTTIREKLSHKRARIEPTATPAQSLLQSINRVLDLTQCQI